MISRRASKAGGGGGEAYAADDEGVVAGGREAWLLVGLCDGRHRLWKLKRACRSDCRYRGRLPKEVFIKRRKGPTDGAGRLLQGVVRG